MPLGPVLLWNLWYWKFAKPMPDLSQRSTREEYMDNPNASETELRESLKELEIINNTLGGHKVVLVPLHKYIRQGEAVTVMDIGSGGGDTLRAIDRYAKRKQWQVQLVGIDINPVMTAYAREHTAAANISFQTADVFDELLLDMHPHITTCSLFCHHFRHEALIALLQRMHALAGRVVIINDLHRHWFAYYAIKVLTRLFSKNAYVRHDGPLSVARAFTRTDWHRIMADCGFKNYTLQWCWAWRWRVVIEKQQ